MPGVMGTLFLFLWEPVHGEGRAYVFTFQKTSQRFYYFGQNEKTILLFGVGRVYEFTDGQIESGGTGVIRSDDAPLIFDSVY